VLAHEQVEEQDQLRQPKRLASPAWLDHAQLLGSGSGMPSSSQIASSIGRVVSGVGIAMDVEGVDGLAVLVP